MKPQVLQMLLMAKGLFIKAEDACSLEDRYEASASLIMLQDSLELIFLAMLLELGIDEKRSLEKISFDELIGELKAQGFVVPKSGSLKALNKQRVIVKHYGEVSEPRTVFGFLQTSKEVIDILLPQIVGRKLSEVVLCDALADCEAKKLLSDAASLIDTGEFYSALVNIRKAIFVEIEYEYNIFDWRAEVAGMNLGLFNFIMKGGSKAPYHTKNKEWISKNVKEAFDFVQIDHMTMNRSLIEWGTNTQDFWNIWRLTPRVVRLYRDLDWMVEESFSTDFRAHAEVNAPYCLDRAVMLLSKKQKHARAQRWLQSDHQHVVEVVAETANLHEKADAESKVVDLFMRGDRLVLLKSIQCWIDGSEFMQVYREPNDIKPISPMGYVLASECRIVQK